MRWVIHSETTFEADHALNSYMGKKEASHRHTWKVAITAGTTELTPEGYALDFHAVHAILRGATSELHDTDLNCHPEIGTPSPTAEHLAEVLADRIVPGLKGIGGTLLTVSIWEGPDNRVDLIL